MCGLLTGQPGLLLLAKALVPPLPNPSFTSRLQQLIQVPITDRDSNAAAAPLDPHKRSIAVAPAAPLPRCAASFPLRHCSKRLSQPHGQAGAMEYITEVWTSLKRMNKRQFMTQGVNLGA